MIKSLNLFVPAVLAAVMLSTVSCAKAPISIDSESASSSPAAVPDMPLGTEPVQTVSPLEEYLSVVESYIDDVIFQTADEEDVRQLSDKLQGHYEITGRTDGGGLEYYVAVRREDAPVYDDYDSLNVGELDAQLYVGYYDQNSDPVVLYELGGYSLLDMPFGYDTGLDSFCFGKYDDDALTENPSFLYAFSQSGRDMLDFMKSRPELSFYQEGQSYVQFYYQDESTIKFYSEPYTCSIALTGAEQEELRQKLETSKTEEGIGSFQEAMTFMRKRGGIKDGIYSTGSSLLLDGHRYKSFGNSEFPGYLMVLDEETGDLLSLEYNEDICRFIREKVKAAVGLDYGYVDSGWFKTPLKSASIAFPEYMGISGAEEAQLRTQTIEDRTKLDALEKLMDQALNNGEVYGFSACPYVAPVDFVREDGETLRIFVATDSCDSMAYEGRISFEYGRQADLAAIFDEAMVKRLEE